MNDFSQRAIQVLSDQTGFVRYNELLMIERTTVNLINFQAVVMEKAPSYSSAVEFPTAITYRYREQ